MLKLRVSAAFPFLAISVAVPWVLATTPGSDPLGQSLTDKTPPPDDFEQRVRDYLLRHPEAIVEALQRWQERQRAAQAEQVKAAIAARSGEIFD